MTCHYTPDTHKTLCTQRWVWEERIWKWFLFKMYSCEYRNTTCAMINLALFRCRRLFHLHKNKCSNSFLHCHNTEWHAVYLARQNSHPPPPLNDSSVNKHTVCVHEARCAQFPVDLCLCRSARTLMIWCVPHRKSDRFPGRDAEPRGQTWSFTNTNT